MQANAKEIFQSDLEYKTWEDLENDLEELLNETYPPFKIGCLEYQAETVLREIDPIAFQQDINVSEDYEEVSVNGETRYYDAEELKDYCQALEDAEEELKRKTSEYFQDVAGGLK